MKLTKLFLVGALSTSALFAHSMWINSFESDSKNGKRVSIGLGWGNKAPIDDSLNSDFGMKSFILTTPDNKSIELKPPVKNPENIFKDDLLSINESNIAMQKIGLNKKSPNGTYSLGFQLPEFTLSEYINKKGKKSKSIKKIEKIRDLKEHISTTVTTISSKSYFTYKNYSEVKAFGHDLEIIPDGDYTKLKEGDIITLNVLLKGKALESGYLLAKSSDDQNINYFHGRVRDGKVKFYLNSNGQWIFKITHTQNKEKTIYKYKTSASINIK